jgi:hypothetical protein
MASTEQARQAAIRRECQKSAIKEELFRLYEAGEREFWAKPADAVALIDQDRHRPGAGGIRFVHAGYQ